MRIQKLNLYTNKIEELKEFYLKTLAFQVIANTSTHFTIKVGWSELTFNKSKKEHIYHYCFLIPTNRINQALEWMKKRIPIIEIESGRKIEHFKNWNAESFYFYDTGGNVVEFIIRHDLKKNINNKLYFEISDIICVNEIGVPTKNIEKLNTKLSVNLKTRFWKGDTKRFGTNGTPEGLFLLPNYNVKETWFPTNLRISPEPFNATILTKGTEHYIEYKDEDIHITKLTPNK